MNNYLSYKIFVIYVLCTPYVWSEEASRTSTMGSYTLEAIKVVVSLALVLLVFYFGVLLFKKYMAGTCKGNASIKMLGGLSLGSKEKIVLIEAGNVNLLLGVSSAGVSKLHCFGDDQLSEHVMEDEPTVKSFNQHFKKFTSKI